MNNPFEVIEARLSSIENLILDLKHKPQTVEPTDQPEQLLTIQEAAQFLSLTVPTMYSKVSKGELPVIKRSKRLYFSRAELLEYLKGGRKKSNAELSKKKNQLVKVILQQVFDCLQFDEDLSECRHLHDDSIWTDGGRFVITLTGKQKNDLLDIIHEIN